jgi:molybdopterin converting factor subunit 1
MMPDGEPTTMVVQIRLFAVLRDRAGTDSLKLILPLHATVGEALISLRERPPLNELPSEIPVVMAVNREYADDTTVLAPGDELALIPPVSGGAAELTRVHVLVTDRPLDLERASRAVEDSDAGAIVIFQGVTRKVSRLHYQAYEEMAREQIERIARAAASSHGLLGVSVEHRIGDVALSEPSVLVAVSAAHRDEAFAGAREIIDSLKAWAPIWKREHEDEGPGQWLTGVEVRP